MTDTKTDLDFARLENELASAYHELATLKNDLIAKDKEINQLKEQLDSINKAEEVGTYYIPEPSPPEPSIDF